MFPGFYKKYLGSMEIKNIYIYICMYNIKNVYSK